VLAHLGLRAPAALGRRRLHAEPLAVRSDIELPSGVRRQLNIGETDLIFGAIIPTASAKRTHVSSNARSAST
jgi:hypothetical protein